MSRRIPALWTSHPSSPQWHDLCQRLVGCRACPRLVAWREEGRRRGKAAYWSRPVPGEGDPKARVLVLGMAPGMEGGNRTGRPFCGDASGRWVREALSRHGWAGGDGEPLSGVYLSNLARCVPPQNRLRAEELARCLPYLREELQLLGHLEVVLALGRQAFLAYLGLREDAPKTARFAHGALVYFPTRPHWLLASYHPSPHNTGPGRLTRAMWEEIWRSVAELAGGSGSTVDPAVLKLHQVVTPSPGQDGAEVLGHRAVGVKAVVADDVGAADEGGVSLNRA
ncbi:MAG: uracil-DNA glycosylase [Firmicutes bacterium]|nr:uracil-DNA glycosylase [Bacillota bacterium]